MDGGIQKRLEQEVGEEQQRSTNGRGITFMMAFVSMEVSTNDILKITYAGDLALINSKGKAYNVIVLQRRL